MTSLTAASLFSGAGGMDLGLEAAGIDVTSFCEFDPTAQSVLARHWPNTPITKDVHDVGHLGGVDLVHGGFPCQDISIAGNREGLAGDRSGLWWEFHRVLSENRPDWCIIENVDGLRSSNGGGDLGAVLGALGDLGYGWAYRVLDARFFGVAQRRSRIFIVGHLGDRRAAQVLLEPEGRGRGVAAGGRARSPVAALTANGVGTCGDVVGALLAGGGERGYRIGADEAGAGAGHLIPLLANTLTARDAKGVPKYVDAGQYNLIPAAVSENQRGEVVLSAHAHAHAHAVSSGGGKPGQGYPAALVRAVHLTQDPVVVDDGVTPSLSCGSPHGCSTIGVTDRRATHPELAVRRLMPIECERLMGWPDDHTRWAVDGVEIADSHRYRMVGNGVVAPVAEWIARRIIGASS